jgi:copper chaperone CopZ
MQTNKPKPISAPMWKHILIVLLIVLLIAASVFASAHMKRTPEGPDAEFRCRLPDIVCDACRGSVTAELKKEAGIRKVRFEGEDRKELVVTHSSRRTPESLRSSLARIGYPAEALDGDPSKAISHQKCVCPAQSTKTRQ